MNLAEKGIIIRKTTEGDLRGIYLSAHGNQEFSSFNLDENYLADLFMSENSIMYSAVRKKKILGFITGKAAGSSLIIETIFVTEKFRRGGIGSALLDKFESRLKKTGASDIHFEVKGENSGLAEFFVRRGFTRERGTVNLRKREL